MKEAGIFLFGKKVNLRPLGISDAATLAIWVNDPEVRRYLSTTFPVTLKKEEEWLSKLGSDDKNIVFGIETKEGKLIGTMGAHGIEWVSRFCTTGALIGEKDYWGQGYGTDAKMILLDYLFNTLNIHKVCSDVIAFNERSLRYSLHCGYKIEGVRRKHIFKEGKYFDKIELGVLKEDWLPVWKRYKKDGKIF